MAAGTALATAGLTAVPAAPPAAAATSTDAVTVNATSGLGTIPPGAIGLNTAVYDSDMNDAPIPGLLKAAGIDALRYPGGSYSDIYNWQTSTAVDSGYVAPGTTFSDFMSTANSAGAQPIITFNYGTGTPALAAAWVQNADVTNSYGIKYWEVGNEVYGNGTYGANWETDSHCDTSLNGTPVTVGSEPSQTYNCGPAEYAAGVKQYLSAVHAADANAKVCAVLTTPGFWPDGVTNSEYPQSWNQTVLTALGSATQCVIVHYYPGGSSTAGMLTDPQDIAGIVSTLHSEISQYAGISNAASVPVLVTETNSTIDTDTQPGALFAADMYMTWLENGVTSVDWWNEHNGEGTVSTVDGATDYGDQGIFSNASSAGGTAEPAADTPFAPYYGIEMLTKLGSPGDEMVTATSGNALVRVHAVRRAGGSLDVLIDNEDPASSYTVNLSYNGFTPSGSPTVYTLGNNATSITSATQNSAASVTVAPYTLTVIQIPGSGGTGITAPGAPGQPTVSGLSSSTSGSTSGTATLASQASTAGTYPVSSYRVYAEGSSGSTPRRDHAGHLAEPDRAHRRGQLHLQRGRGGQPGEHVAAVPAGYVHRATPIQQQLRGALRGQQQLARRVRGGDHHHQQGQHGHQPVDAHVHVPGGGRDRPGWLERHVVPNRPGRDRHRRQLELQPRGQRRNGQHRVQRHRHGPGSGPHRPVGERDGLRK